MAVYILTYDLNQEYKRPPIVDFIKEHYDWAMLSESSYAIESELSAATIYSIFSHFIDNNDSLYVARIIGPVEGYGYVAVNEWLAKRLPPTLALAA